MVAFGRKICQRCGWEYPYAKIKTEPGTNLEVCTEACYDGKWSSIEHPQNKPIANNILDAIALRNPSPDESEQVGVFVYGETSNGFGSDYIGTYIEEP